MRCQRAAVSTASDRNRPPPDPDLQTCDMCAEPITSDHRHVVDIQSRQLMCTCRGCGCCSLPRRRTSAIAQCRTVICRFPTLSSPKPAGTLDIPVGLAFFFSSSVLGRVVAFYPGPAGVTESELGLAAWTEVLEANPELGVLSDDVEALLVRAPDPDHEAQPASWCRSTHATSWLGRLRTVGAASTAVRMPRGDHGLLCHGPWRLVAASSPMRPERSASRD